MWPQQRQPACQRRLTEARRCFASTGPSTSCASLRGYGWTLAWKGFRPLGILPQSGESVRTRTDILDQRVAQRLRDCGKTRPRRCKRSVCLHSLCFGATGASPKRLAGQQATRYSAARRFGSGGDNMSPLRPKPGGSTLRNPRRLHALRHRKGCPWISRSRLTYKMHAAKHPRYRILADGLGKQSMRLAISCAICTLPGTFTLRGLRSHSQLDFCIDTIFAYGHTIAFLEVD